MGCSATRVPRRQTVRPDDQRVSDVGDLNQIGAAADQGRGSGSGVGDNGRDGCLEKVLPLPRNCVVWKP